MSAFTQGALRNQHPLPDRVNYKKSRKKALAVLFWAAAISQLFGDAAKEAQPTSTLPPIVPSFPPSLKAYFELYQHNKPLFGPLGNHREGEIEILINPEEIAQVEAVSFQAALQKGMDEACAKKATRVGVLSEDAYWYFLRDAVVFPSGFKGLYNRIIEKSSVAGIGGVAVAALLPDGRLVLVVTYRHATRSWEVELPRGSRNAGETLEQAAIREVREETGYHLQSPTLLGLTHPASGMSSVTRAVMVGYALEKKATQLDNSEAITGVVALSRAQIRQGYKRGFIEVPIHGQLRKIVLQDPYLPYALLVGEEKGLW